MTDIQEDDECSIVVTVHVVGGISYDRNGGLPFTAIQLSHTMSKCHESPPSRVAISENRPRDWNIEFNRGKPPSLQK